LLAVYKARKHHVPSDDATWALIAQSVGAVMLARAMRETTAGRRVLTGVKRNGRALLRTKYQVQPSR